MSCLEASSRGLCQMELFLMDAKLLICIDISDDLIGDFPPS